MTLTMEEHLAVSVRPLPFSKMPVHEWRADRVEPASLFGWLSPRDITSVIRTALYRCHATHGTSSHISHEDVAMALLDAEETSQLH